MNPPNQNRPERIAIEISWGTILRCLSVILLIAIMVPLGPLIGLLLVSILLAVTLEVVVKWLIGMGVKRRIAVLILLLVTAGVVAAVGLFLLPAIVGQAQTVGEKTRLSNLAVLLAISAGGLLAGVIGVILALPAAAAYPPIERIWLKKYLGEDVLEEHQKLEHQNRKNKV